MPFVLDASVAASWGFADEYSAVAEFAETRLQSDTALVPRIWWYEIRNLLVVNERRKRITSDDSSIFLGLLASYPIQFDSVDDEAACFRLARQFKLSFYDAAYLQVAQRNRIPLATLDKALRHAAESAGIPLLQ